LPRTAHWGGLHPAPGPDLLICHIVGMMFQKFGFLGALPHWVWAGSTTKIPRLVMVGHHAKFSIALATMAAALTIDIIGCWRLHSLTIPSHGPDVSPC